MKKRVVVHDTMQHGETVRGAPRSGVELFRRQRVAAARGRRGPDDARQIARWRAIARHAAAIRKHCEPGDRECRPRQRQGLLHWAYDSRNI